MKTYYFDVSMSYARCIDLYADAILYVVVQAHTNETIRLPKENLKPFLLPSGIHGRFKLMINSQNKIVSLNKC